MIKMQLIIFDLGENKPYWRTTSKFLKSIYNSNFDLKMGNYTRFLAMVLLSTTNNLIAVLFVPRRVLSRARLVLDTLQDAGTELATPVRWLPNRMLTVSLAVSILVLTLQIEGMMRGDTGVADFTSAALEDHVSAGVTDYEQARRVVNPGDKPTYPTIAAYARAFEAALDGACWSQPIRLAEAA